METKIFFSDTEYERRKPHSLRWAYRRQVMAGFMMFSDVLCLIISIELALLLWVQVRSDLVPAHYQPLLLPVSLLFVVIYFSFGLYPGIGLGSVEELRRMSIGTFLGMLGLMGLSFYLRNVNEWSRAVLGLTLVFMLVGAPLARKVTRRIALYFELWGVPVAVIGETDYVEHIFTSLRQSWLNGLCPVLCIKTTSLQHVFPSASHKKSGKHWEANGIFDGIEIAIVVPNHAPLGSVKQIMVNPSHRFQRVIVMFNESRMGPMWFTPLLLADHLGLEARHQLINPLHQFIKRLLDLVLIIIFLPLLLPLFLLIMLAIKLDSRGPVFFTQKRVGFDGKSINIWKFRSMVKNADEVLRNVLAADPNLRAEWEHNFKLKHDPRITRVGKFLRQTSLDELPQLWNVLKHDMSLIGPRPIVEDEIPLYNENFEIFKQVQPGMTGMWQISGRNNLSYDERVNLDVYYVQNWSVWLDLHILLHTVLIVIKGSGAY